MENGVSRSVAAGETRHLAAPRDALGALLLAEAAAAQCLDLGLSATPSPDLHNAFGEPVALEPLAPSEQRVTRAAQRAASGQRTALVSSSAELYGSRHVMARMVEQRLSVVFHAVESSGAEAAFALADLGWGMLFASDVSESLDLSLVARRASEDSGTPFLVIHDRSSAARTEALAAPSPDFIDAFLGSPAARAKRPGESEGGGGPSSPRAFAERVPFALGSAFRELEALTGRKRDLLTRSQATDAPLMLAGLGAMGDLLLGEVARLRAAGHDVGAVKLTAFRPFPGPRVVRVLARALAISVLERQDEPLAQSNPLTREVKAAFADALTWAPDYPGIGRIPRIHSGVAPASVHELDAHDLDAVVRNMLQGEHGRRFFGVGGGGGSHALTRDGTAAEPA